MDYSVQAGSLPWDSPSSSEFTPILLSLSTIS